MCRNQLKALKMVNDLDLKILHHVYILQVCKDGTVACLPFGIEVINCYSIVLSTSVAGQTDTGQVS